VCWQEFFVDNNVKNQLKAHKPWAHKNDTSQLTQAAKSMVEKDSVLKDSSSFLRGLRAGNALRRDFNLREL
jgi:hypothetical protein